ncbi:MAG: agglutinin biogenesis protein [Gallionella sp.]|nr:agglutinin biogenesis protein [Gallionella sp.]
MKEFNKQLSKYWNTAHATIDAMSLRERAMVFLATAFVLISLLNALLLDPLLAKQKALSQKVVQQQDQMREQQATIQTLLNAKRDDQNSPLRLRAAQLRAQLQEQNLYLSSRSEHLVPPEQIANLLEQVLLQQGKLQLLTLETLPLAPLIEKPPVEKINGTEQLSPAKDSKKEIFKHGVRITMRGNYLDVLRYLTALENMPTKMFWGEMTFKVESYPDAVVSLTLFTLSLDKTWLAV